VAAAFATNARDMSRGNIARSVGRSNLRTA